MHRKMPAWFGPGVVGKGAANSGNLANGLPVLLARIRGLNRLELAGETMRAALEALAVVAPGWLAGQIDDDWVTRYEARVDSYRLPASETKRTALAVQYGTDGYALLAAVYAAGAARGWLAQVPAVEVLRQVWVQQYYRTTVEGREVVSRREADDHGVPPGRFQLISPYDLDARYSVKREHGWAGYKVHFSETCDSGVDHTGRGPAEPDHERDHHGGDGRGRVDDHTDPPGSWRRRICSRGGICWTPATRRRTCSSPRCGTSACRLVTPLLADQSAQAKAGAGYDRTAFTIDWDQQQATCPQGAVSAIRGARAGKRGRHHRGHVPDLGVSAVSGPHRVHPLHRGTPPTVPATPRDSRGTDRGPGRAEQPGVEGTSTSCGPGWKAPCIRPSP